MNSHWFAFAMLVASLAIGYTVFVSRESPLPTADEQLVMHGRYMRDAIITETNAAGAPRARFAASEVVEDQTNDSVTMTDVRADYVWSDQPSAGGAPTSAHAPSRRHWVLNADQATLTAENQLALRGNVEAHNVPSGDERALSLVAPTLDIDTDEEIARTDDDVAVQLAGHSAEARGLTGDFKRQRWQLRSQVAFTVAAANPEQPSQKPRLLSLPESCKSDSAVYESGTLFIKQLRCTDAPAIQANEARATGADMANNRWTLSGAVRVALPQQGHIDADEAIIAVRDGRVQQVELTGAPVRFQHRRPASGDASEQTINGSAARITYDVPAQMLSMSGEALFNNGSFEIAFDSIDYNLTTGAARGTNSRGRSLQRPAEQVPPPAPPL